MDKLVDSFESGPSHSVSLLAQKSNKKVHVPFSPPGGAPRSYISQTPCLFSQIVDVST